MRTTHAMAMTTPMNAPADRRADVVLIVDDVPDNLAVLHDTLDESGYTVLVATDGPSALERALRAQPDVILLDAMMPGMDGFEVARRLKAEARTAAIPIIFMTGLTETEHVVAAFAAGGTDYVTKPIRAREVIARITAHSLAAREQQQARNALDAFGHATLMVRMHDGRIVWQTALARQLLEQHFASEGRRAPVAVLAWLQRETARLVGLEEGPVPGSPSLVVDAAASGGGCASRCTRLPATASGCWCCARPMMRPRWRRCRWPSA